MRESFNVIEEPWISVTGEDNRPLRISIREALTHSKKYRCLSLPSVLERTAMLRMLCAFDFRILYWYLPDGMRRSVKDADDVMGRLKDMIGRGGITDEQLDAYVEDCNQKAGFHTRFDALDNEMPFLQSAERRDGTETRSGKLKIRVMNSKNKSRWATPGDQDAPVAVEDAIAALTVIQSFDDQGVKTKEGDVTSGVGPVADHALVYFTGNTLLDDLVYNLCLLDENGNLYGDDVPIWEIPPFAPQVDVVKKKEDAADPKKGRPRNSPAAFYAPRGRRPLFMMNDDGEVIGIHNRFGDRFAQSAETGFTDPMQIWRRKDADLYPVRVFKIGTDPAWTLESQIYEMMHYVIGEVIPYDAEEAKKKEKDPDVLREETQKRRLGTARTPSVVTWCRRVLDANDDKKITVNIQGLAYGPQNGCISDVSADSLCVPKEVIGEGKERDNMIRLCAAADELVYQAFRFGTALDDARRVSKGAENVRFRVKAMDIASACVREAAGDDCGGIDESIRRIGTEICRMAEDAVFHIAAEASPDRCRDAFQALNRIRGAVVSLEKKYVSDEKTAKRGKVMPDQTESVLRKKMLSAIGKIQSNAYTQEAKRMIAALCRTSQMDFYTDVELSDMVFSSGSDGQVPDRALSSDAAKAASFALRMYGIHQRGKIPYENPMHIMNSKENGYRFTFGRALNTLLAKNPNDGSVKKYMTAVLGSSTIGQMEIPCRSLVRDLARNNIPMDYADFAVFVYRLCFGNPAQKQEAVIRFGSDAFGKRN